MQHACKHYRQSKRETAPEIKWTQTTQEEIYTLGKHTPKPQHNKQKTDEKENKKISTLIQRKQEKETYRENIRHIEKPLMDGNAPNQHSKQQTKKQPR